MNFIHFRWHQFFRLIKYLSLTVFTFFFTIYSHSWSYAGFRAPDTPRPPDAPMRQPRQPPTPHGAELQEIPTSFWITFFICCVFNLFLFSTVSSDPTELAQAAMITGILEALFLFWLF